MTTLDLGPVPAVLDIDDDTLTVGRAWPRAAHAGSRILLVEGRDNSGQLRAARLGLRRSGGRWEVAKSCVAPQNEDPRLPDLAAMAAGGTLLVHRFGRRAVVRRDDSYVKVVRPGHGRVAARAASTGRELALEAGFDAPTVEEVHNGHVAFGVLPGQSLHELGAVVTTTQWTRLWAVWAASWPVLAQPVPDPSGRDLLPHSPADEAALLKRWVDHVCDFGALPEEAVRRLGQRAQAVAQALLRGPAQRLVVSHRDLHDKQVLALTRTGCPKGSDARSVHPATHLGLLDFDTVALAEPALDLANLFVHAALRADQGHWSPAHRDICQRAVLTAATELDVDLGRFETYAEATRVRLACLYAFRPGQRALALSWAGAA